MNKIFKLILAILLIVGLAGAVLLVQKNQETRRGATQAESSASILPDKVTKKINENVVLQLWVNTGKSIDKLAGADVQVIYNKEVLQFVNFEPIANSGYTLLTNEVNKTQGIVEVKMVAMGAEKAGAVNLGKLTFKAIKTGNVNVKVKSGSNIMVTGKNAVWVMPKLNDSTVTITGTGGPTATPTTRPPTAVISSAILPKIVSSDIGKTFTVTVRVNSGGPNSEKLRKANLVINYDNSKFVYLKKTGLAGYKVTNANVEPTKGRLVFNMTAGSTRSAFPMNLIRLTFGSVENGQGSITMAPASKVWINAQTTAKSITTRTGSVVTIGSNEPTPPEEPTPPDEPTPSDPTPSDGTSGADSILNYKVAFANVNPNNAKCVVDWPLKIMVMGDGQTKTYEDVMPTSSEAVDNKLVFSGSLILEGFNKRNGVAAFISGPKELQTKYGVGGQTTAYGKAGGELVLTDNEESVVYDFSQYPMLAGDVVANDSQDRQDGIINGVDFAYVKARSIAHETADTENGEFYLQGDLNGDCQVNTGDVTILKSSLADKQGELY